MMLGLGKSLAALALMASVWAAALPAQAAALLAAGQVQLGRYTTDEAKPDATAAQPLLALAQISFPRSVVKTVGDALRYTLLRTGYQLRLDALTSDATDFMSLALPESQRQLGYYPVQDMLQVLLGPTWGLQVDEHLRRVWFVARSNGAAAPVATKAQTGE